MEKEKKEIGIEKLVELLNEYEPRIAGNGEHYDNIWWYRHFMSDKTVANNATRYIVSKEYGFIKWLVENDKIDFNKCGLDVRHYLSYNERYDKGIVMAENYDNDTLVREFYSPYKQLLMLLSISDTPIEDLISYLK